MPESAPIKFNSASKVAPPVHRLSVERIALGFARLVNAAGLDPGLRAACERLVAAVLDHPELVATRAIAYAQTSRARVAARSSRRRGPRETLYKGFDQNTFNKSAIVDGDDIGDGKFNIYIHRKSPWGQSWNAWMRISSFGTSLMKR